MVKSLSTVLFWTAVVSYCNSMLSKHIKHRSLSLCEPVIEMATSTMDINQNAKCRRYVVTMLCSLDNGTPDLAGQVWIVRYVHEQRLIYRKPRSILLNIIIA